MDVVPFEGNDYASAEHDANNEEVWVLKVRNSIKKHRDDNTVYGALLRKWIPNIDANDPFEFRLLTVDIGEDNPLIAEEISKEISKEEALVIETSPTFDTTFETDMHQYINDILKRLNYQNGDIFSFKNNSNIQ